MRVIAYLFILSLLLIGAPLSQSEAIEKHHNNEFKIPTTTKAIETKIIELTKQKIKLEAEIATLSKLYGNNNQNLQILKISASKADKAIEEALTIIQIFEQQQIEAIKQLKEIEAYIEELTYWLENEKKSEIYSVKH